MISNSIICVIYNIVNQNSTNSVVQYCPWSEPDATACNILSQERAGRYCLQYTVSVASRTLLPAIYCLCSEPDATACNILPQIGRAHV